MTLTIEITIEDHDWPNLGLIIKEGTRVHTEKALKDVAPSKFQSTINNFVNRATAQITDRRMRNV